MGGWIDWYTEKLNCPFCGKIISILFYEEGTTIENDPVIISIASDKNICPECDLIITRKKIYNALKLRVKHRH